MVGMLLTFMQECDEDVYFIATCNDMDVLLRISQGALLRRFDDIFFVDLPTKEERKEIIKIKAVEYKVELEGEEQVEEMAGRSDGWTGAEIEKWIRNSLYDGLDVARANIRPISVQNREVIDKARQWAMYNAIAANSKEEERREGRAIRA
jgi:SpoVK/Ycf46/Vps4 family AAA+-type ATPase